MSSHYLTHGSIDRLKVSDNLCYIIHVLVQYFKVVELPSYRHLADIDTLIINTGIIWVEEETKILKLTLYIAVYEYITEKKAI